MSTDMLGVAIRKLVTLPGEVLGVVCDLLEKLSDPEWIAATKRFLRKENPWPKLQLLKLIATATLPAVQKFIARVAFSDNNPDGIKFYLWDGFKDNFLDKIEENVPATELAVHELTKTSLDEPIRGELTSVKEEITLAHMYELIKRQKNGETGLLLTNGKANIFYIHDAKGNFWAVDSNWRSDDRGWHVLAYSVAHPDEWRAGGLVLSQV